MREFIGAIVTGLIIIALIKNVPNKEIEQYYEEPVIYEYSLTYEEQLVDDFRTEIRDKNLVLYKSSLIGSNYIFEIEKHTTDNIDFTNMREYLERKFKHKSIILIVDSRNHELVLNTY